MNVRTLVRKSRLIIVAIMIGVSNVIYEEDKSIDANSPKTEQEQGDEEFNKFESNG